MDASRRLTTCDVVNGQKSTVRTSSFASAAGFGCAGEKLTNGFQSYLAVDTERVRALRLKSYLKFAEEQALSSRALANHQTSADVHILRRGDLCPYLRKAVSIVNDQVIVLKVCYTPVYAVREA